MFTYFSDCNYIIYTYIFVKSNNLAFLIFFRLVYIPFGKHIGGIKPKRLKNVDSNPILEACYKSKRRKIPTKQDILVGYFCCRNQFEKPEGDNSKTMSKCEIQLGVPAFQANKRPLLLLKSWVFWLFGAKLLSHCLWFGGREWNRTEDRGWQHFFNPFFVVEILTENYCRRYGDKLFEGTEW